MLVRVRPNLCLIINYIKLFRPKIFATLPLFVTLHPIPNRTKTGKAQIGARTGKFKVGPRREIPPPPFTTGHPGPGGGGSGELLPLKIHSYTLSIISLNWLNDRRNGLLKQSGSRDTSKHLQTLAIEGQPTLQQAYLALFLLFCAPQAESQAREPSFPLTMCWISIHGLLWLISAWPETN